MKKGTGLGLAIVNQLVEMHDGMFCLESVVGVGTKAIVYIPSKNVRISERLPELHVVS